MARRDMENDEGDNKKGIEAEAMPNETVVPKP